MARDATEGCGGGNPHQPSPCIGSQVSPPSSVFQPSATANDELVWADDNTLLAVTHGRGICRGVIPDDSACAGLFRCDSNCDAPFSYRDLSAFRLAVADLDGYEEEYLECDLVCNNIQLVRAPHRETPQITTGSRRHCSKRVRFARGRPAPS